MTIPKHRTHIRQEVEVADWQTIYCSIALILVVLFVMLVSYSSADRMKMNKIKDNLQGVITGHSGMNNNLATERSNNNTILIHDAMHLLRRSNSAQYFQQGITIERTKDGFKCKINNDLMFESGSAVVSDKIYPYLDDIIRIAKTSSFYVRVEGHTDNIPVQGKEHTSNWELSAERAVNVIRYLLEKGNISAYRLAAHGFGQYHPVADNDTAVGRSQNRRTEVYFELNPIYP